MCKCSPNAIQHKISHLHLKTQNAQILLSTYPLCIAVTCSLTCLLSSTLPRRAQGTVPTPQEKQSEETGNNHRQAPASCCKKLTAPRIQSTLWPDERSMARQGCYCTLQYSRKQPNKKEKGKPLTNHYQCNENISD